jgi:hypothetical protein
LLKSSENDLTDIILEKSYGQQLTDQEIDEIINTEIRRHTTFIEKQIEDLEIDEIINTEIRRHTTFIEKQIEDLDKGFGNKS